MKTEKKRRTDVDRVKLLNKKQRGKEGSRNTWPVSLFIPLSLHLLHIKKRAD